MLDALRRNGWRNYSLFMREDGLMFGYFKVVVKVAVLDLIKRFDRKKRGYLY